MKRETYLYSDLTWPELRDAVKRQPVVLLPVGSVEDHGPHLPLDTDNAMPTRICHDTARRIPDEALVMPTVPYGFNWHHIDFPGTIGIQWDNFVNYMTDITKSVAYHGFKKILIVDGHGSNLPLVDIVARRTIMETDALCASMIYTNLIVDIAREIRESDVPGGMAHACELETSLYWHVDPERVQPEKFQKEIGLPPSQFIWLDLTDPSPVQMMEWWSTFSHTGVVGDPTAASKEKGARIYEALIDRMVALVQDMKARPIRDRADLHLDSPVTPIGK
jgi:creatinine amidohydrolase